MTDTILKAQLKVREVLQGYNHIVMSVSGGSDSDIMIDICKDFHREMKFVYIDTGIEYDATKRHLQYLMQKYDINIEIYKPKQTIPNIVKKYGVPVMSKKISESLYRLQKHNFDFNNDDFDTNYKRYPNSKAALRWYCNHWDNNILLGIERNKYLKEFLHNHKPDFKISNKCCLKVKENTIAKIADIYNCDLSVVGLRKAEGGQRSTVKSCWNLSADKYDTFYPLLFFTNKDKEIYKKENNIVYSDCYEVYGLQRTGCAGCPFGKDYKAELGIIAKYEPKLYKAIFNIFRDSYDFQDAYENYRRFKNEKYPKL